MQSEFSRVREKRPRSTLGHWRAIIIRGTIPSTFSAGGWKASTIARRGNDVKQWDTDKLGCVLETSWHSYRQTVVGSWQMLLDCPPARTSLLLPFPFLLLLSIARRRLSRTKKGKTRESLRFDSNRVKRALPWKNLVYWLTQKMLKYSHIAETGRNVLSNDYTNKRGQNLQLHN